MIQNDKELPNSVIQFNNSIDDISSETANLRPYFQWGWRRKRVIVFVHGFSSNYQSHEDIFKKLKRNGYKYYAFNLPGHGDNLSESEAEMKVDSYARLVAKFIIDQDLKNVIIVGHSMGGAIAVMVNALIGSYIDCLVLEDPLNKAAFSFKKERIFSAILGKDPNTGKHMGLFGWVKNIYQKKKEYKSLFKDIISSKTNRSIEWAYQQIKDKPVFLMFGKNDLIIPPKDTVDYISQCATNLEVCIFENAGHSPHKDAPELYYQYLIAFLKKTNKNFKVRHRSKKTKHLN